MPNQYEISRGEQIVDVRPWSTRTAESLSQPVNLLMALGSCIAVTLVVPVLIFVTAPVGLAIILGSRQSSGWVPIRYPPSAINPENKKKGDGIWYVGNMEFDRDKNRRLPLESAADKFREVWFADDDMRKHMLILGSTGSGKSELLKGIFYCALCWGSGFFIADGKADNNLPLDVYALTRFFGRDDDLLVLNFLLAGKTPQQVRTARKRRTNKTNPFSTADSDTIIQMGTNLLPKVDGDAKNWQEKALLLWRGLVPALCWLRDNEGMEISVTTFQEYLALSKVEELYAKGYALSQSTAGVWSEGFVGLKAYLEVGLPGFKIDRCLKKHNMIPRGPAGNKPEPTDQDATVYDQHGYRATQLNPALSLLDKTYGHIFADKYSEVDMIDVTLNNRILVMLIPSLERSAQEAESLGKLTVACLRVMMGRNLGADIEGTRERILESKATEARYPYIVALDELGYYFADGIAVMFAMARSLGFSMIAAAQDVEKLTEGTRAAEAGAMLANQVCKIFMRIDDANKTNEMIQKYLGKVNVAIKETYEYRGMMGFKRMAEVKVAELPVATLTNLQSLPPGRAILNSMGKTFKVSTFYIGDFLQKYPRETFHINRFLQVRATTLKEVLEGVDSMDGRVLISMPLDPGDDKQVRGQRMRDYLTGHALPPDPRELADNASYSPAHDRALGLVNVLARAAQALPPGVAGAKRGALFYAAARRYVIETRAAEKEARAAGGNAGSSAGGAPLINRPGAAVDDDFVTAAGAMAAMAIPPGSLIEHGSGSGEGGAAVADVHDDPLLFINADKPLERKPAEEVLTPEASATLRAGGRITKAGLEAVVVSEDSHSDDSAELKSEGEGEVAEEGANLALLPEIDPQLRSLLNRTINAGLVIHLPHHGTGALRREQHRRAAADAQWIGRALTSATAGLASKGDTLVGFTDETKKALVSVEQALGNTKSGESAAAVEQLVAHQTTPAPLPAESELTADIDSLLDQAERAAS